MKLSERRKWVVCAHPLKKVPVSNWKILTEKRTGPQTQKNAQSFHHTLDFGVLHVHLGQIRATGENFDVTCTNHLIYEFKSL